jgi:hypothetical protein
MHSEGLAGKTETFVRYGVTPRLELGFGYLWKQKIVRPLGTYTIVTETTERPAWTVGLLTDSLGSGRTGVFTSVTKDIQKKTGLPLSLYVGLARVSNEDGTRFLTGTSVRLGHSVIASAQYDGHYVNLGLTAQVGKVGSIPIRFGIVAAKGNQIGPLVATIFPLRPSGH